MTRFDRNVRLFGEEGQAQLRKAQIAIIGVGGLGSHVAQQLALLGVGSIVLIDNEEVSLSNRNRYVDVCYDDPIPGTHKVDVAGRMIRRIDPEITVDKIPKSLISKQAFHKLRSVSHVFGCLDNDGPRFVLNQIASTYGKPYLDLASDVIDGEFGGRIMTNWFGRACLFCIGELDQVEIQKFLEDTDARANRQSVYGVDQSFLDARGPSVVSVNGVIASLAVTEFMVGRTGMREPKPFINYRGSQGCVFVRDVGGRPDCPYCSEWGTGETLELDRYLRS